MLGLRKLRARVTPAAAAAARQEMLARLLFTPFRSVDPYAFLSVNA